MNLLFIALPTLFFITYWLGYYRGYRRATKEWLDDKWGN